MDTFLSSNLDGAPRGVRFWCYCDLLEKVRTFASGTGLVMGGPWGRSMADDLQCNTRSLLQSWTVLVLGFGALELEKGLGSWVFIQQQREI